MIPAPLTMRHGKSALTRVFARATASAKAVITETFTDMNNLVVLSGNPYISSGMLTGQGAVRYRDEVLTDNFKVTGTIGSHGPGRTWLVTSASPNFDRFYALEINEAGVSMVSIIRGTGLVATTSSGIFGILIGILGFILGVFEDIIGVLTGEVEIECSVDVGETLAIWWDQPNSRVRVYHNGSQITSLLVPRHGIPHGKGYRYFGVISGIDEPLEGTRFTQIVAEDV